MLNPWTDDFDNTENFHRALNALAPFGFVDSSWHNDVSPSILLQDHDGNELMRVWIDYRDPTLRELGPNNAPYVITIGEMRESIEFNDIDMMLRRAAVLAATHLVANRYETEVRRLLTDEELEEMRNDADKFPNDFYDANETALSAYVFVLGSPWDEEGHFTDEALSVVNTAIDIAIANIRER